MTADEVRAQRVEQLAIFMAEQEKREESKLPLADKYPELSNDFTRRFDPIDMNVFEILTRICSNHPGFGEALADLIRRGDDESNV